MGKREAFLASEDVGASLDAVEALIKKHEDIDKSLQAEVRKNLLFLLESSDLIFLPFIFWSWLKL